MTIQNISVQSLNETMNDHHPDFLLIDVREVDEWQAGHIQKAIHIPLASLESLIHQTATSLDQPIFLQCKSGGRSMQAAQKLQRLGYTKLFNVDGGILAWSQAGYPTI